MDLNIIAEAFVIVVVGGMGSIAGAFLAAVLIAELNAFGILVFPQITLVLMFLVMAAILVVRPWGLLGRPEFIARGPGETPEAPYRPADPRLRALGWAALGVLLAVAIQAVFLQKRADGLGERLLEFSGRLGLGASGSGRNQP